MIVCLVAGIGYGSLQGSESIKELQTQQEIDRVIGNEEFTQKEIAPILGEETSTQEEIARILGKELLTQEVIDQILGQEDDMVEGGTKIDDGAPRAPLNLGAGDDDFADYVPDLTIKQALTRDGKLEDFKASCPHCFGDIFIPGEAFNCKIFRHLPGLNPHSSRWECGKALRAKDTHLFGCARPYRIIGINGQFFLQQCEHI